MPGHVYNDRTDAGQELASHLQRYTGRDDVVVLGLPRGGVPVAYEVAKALQAPLDVLVVRKLGVPGHEEFAFGAIATGGVNVLQDSLIQQLGLGSQTIDKVIEQESAELSRREAAYRGERPFPVLKGKIVILVDDGLATGATMRAAAMAVQEFEPARVVVAAPTGSSEACMAMEGVANEVVCANMPTPFRAVGAWYRNFSQTSDQEVRQLLAS